MRVWQGVLATGLVAASAAAQTSDRAINDQLARYDQIIDKLQQQNIQLMQDQRNLEHQHAVLVKELKAATDKVATLSDQLQNFQNTDIVNLNAGEKQLAQQLKTTRDQLWGNGQRNCPDLGVKHQQVKVATRPDGSRTVRFLCFDGKALHLETEAYDPTD